MKKVFKYTLTENDFIDFQLHYLKINSNVSSTIKKTIIVLIILYLIVFVSMSIYFRDNVYLILIIFILVSAFSIMQVLTYRKRLEGKIIKKIKKYISSGKLNNIFGDKELTIYDDKVVFYENEAYSNYKKDDIKNIDFSNRSIFFYTDDLSAIIIPKSFLSNEDIEFLLSYRKY